MLYGSETQAVKEEDVCRLKCTDMSIVRWMCSAFFNDRPRGIRIANVGLRRRKGLKCISDVLKRGR